MQSWNTSRNKYTSNTHQRKMLLYNWKSLEAKTESRNVSLTYSLKVLNRCLVEHLHIDCAVSGWIKEGWWHHRGIMSCTGCLHHSRWHWSCQSAKGCVGFKTSGGVTFRLSTRTLQAAECCSSVGFSYIRRAYSKKWPVQACIIFSETFGRNM